MILPAYDRQVRGRSVILFGAFRPIATRWPHIRNKLTLLGQTMSHLILLYRHSQLRAARLAQRSLRRTVNKLAHFSCLRLQVLGQVLHRANLIRYVVRDGREPSVPCIRSNIIHLRPRHWPSTSIVAAASLDGYIFHDVPPKDVVLPRSTSPQNPKQPTARATGRSPLHNVF